MPRSKRLARCGVGAVMPGFAVGCNVLRARASIAGFCTCLARWPLCRARAPERAAGKTLRRARRTAHSADLPDTRASLHLPRLQQLHILLLRQGSIADASGLADLHRLLRRRRQVAVCAGSLILRLGFGAWLGAPMLGPWAPATTPA